jgi:hypothetical protein
MDTHKRKADADADENAQPAAVAAAEKKPRVETSSSGALVVADSKKGQQLVLHSGQVCVRAHARCATCAARTAAPSTQRCSACTGAATAANVGSRRPPSALHP